MVDKLIEEWEMDEIINNNRMKPDADGKMVSQVHKIDDYLPLLEQFAQTSHDHLSKIQQSKGNIEILKKSLKEEEMKLAEYYEDFINDILHVEGLDISNRIRVEARK